MFVREPSGHDGPGSRQAARSRLGTQGILKPSQALAHKGAGLRCLSSNRKPRHPSRAKGLWAAEGLHRPRPQGGLGGTKARVMLQSSPLWAWCSSTESKTLARRQLPGSGFVPWWESHQAHQALPRYRLLAPAWEKKARSGQTRRRHTREPVWVEMPATDTPARQQGQGILGTPWGCFALGTREARLGQRLGRLSRAKPHGSWCSTHE